MSTPFVDTFVPFFGVIEDVDDPREMGRVRVRCYGYHSENKAYIPTDYLQWFTCVVSNSAGVSGVGHSPTEYLPGSTVFGYFLDGTFQEGIIIGVISGTPTHPSYMNIGFNDPSGRMPRYISESDVNRLARASGKNHWLYAVKENARFKGTKGPLRDGEWSEPAYDNNAVYPKNQVYETEAGHIKEYDDTEGNERIHEYHKSGSYTEIRADGTRVVKVVGDGYEIVAGKKHVLVNGDANLTVAGSLNLYVQGDYNVQVDGNKTEVVQGDYKARHGSHSVLADDDVDFDGNRINLNIGSASGNAGIQVTLPPEYDVTFAGPVIKSAGRYAALDEPGFTEQTPQDYPDDEKPQSYDGEVKEEAPVKEEQKPTPDLTDCMTITTPIDYNIKLSDNYTIGSLSTNALFPHNIKAQVGLSEQEIVCNLQALAENIIEPLRSQFGSFRINSGFRTGSGKSQHNKGQAVDIQEPGWSAKKHLEVAQWALENLPVDQIIIEHGNAIWIHISFDRNKAAQRGMPLTMLNGSYSPGLKLYYS